MLLIREVFHCKPGQVRALIEIFQKMNEVHKKLGWGTARLMTDLSAERYWTAVAEFEAQSLAEFEDLMKKSMANPEIDGTMKGYHDLVVDGRREIYTIVS